MTEQRKKLDQVNIRRHHHFAAAGVVFPIYRRRPNEKSSQFYPANRGGE